MTQPIFLSLSIVDAISVAAKETDANRPQRPQIKYDS